MILSNSFGKNCGKYFNKLKEGYRQLFEKQVKSIQNFITFLANPVTNENHKTHHRIGMYKKMNRVIENKKGFLLRVRNPPFVATDNRTLC